MHHFFITADGVRGDRVLLTGAEAHHAGRVLRVKIGEPISVADGSGRVLDAVVTRIAQDAVEARIILAHDRASPRPSLVLCQGVAKGDRMDFVAQKAVEIGARRIVPFMASRTVVRWDDERRDKARARWQEIALAAAKQSRSAWRTEVDPVLSDAGAVAGTLVTPTVVLHEAASTLLRDALPPEPPEQMAIVVGPEGGLEQAEVNTLVEAGATAVTLGERILRTETAGLVALALVSFAYGSLG